MSDLPVAQREVVRQLLDLGVRPGGVLIVHTSFSRVGPIEGGPEGLIAALLAAVGHDGTLVMPSMSDDYSEIDPCCQNFNLMNEWLDAVHRQHRGRVGHADARLIRSRDVVDVAGEHLRRNQMAFLHAFGVDHECDEARASLDR